MPDPLPAARSADKRRPCAAPAARSPRAPRRAFAEIGRAPRPPERGRGVERDRVGRRAASPPNTASVISALRAASPPARSDERAQLDAELARVDLARASRRRLTVATVVAPHGESSSMPRCAVHDQRVLARRARQRLRHRLDQLRRVDADQLAPRARRVRQRPEQVEDRAHAELAPHRARVAHRRVVRRARTGSRTRSSMQRAPARAPSVDRARRAPRARRPSRSAMMRAVAVLGDARRRRGRDERRRRRDVERARAVAARAAVSTQVVAHGRHGHTCARIARAAPTISSTVSPLARSADEQAGDLGRVGLAAHHEPDGGFGVARAQGRRRRAGGRSSGRSRRAPQREEVARDHDRTARRLYAASCRQGRPGYDRRAHRQHRDQHQQPMSTASAKSCVRHCNMYLGYYKESGSFSRRSMEGR